MMTRTPRPDFPKVSGANDGTFPDLTAFGFDAGSVYTGACIFQLKAERGVYYPDRFFLHTIHRTEQDPPMSRMVWEFLNQNWPKGPKGGFSPDVILAVEAPVPPSAKRRTKNWDETAKVRGAVEAWKLDGVPCYSYTADQVRRALNISPMSKETRKQLRSAGVHGVSPDSQVRRAVCTLTGLNPKFFGDCHQVDAFAELVVALNKNLRFEWRKP